MKKIKGYARFLVDNGLLFEINRRILHPLGLDLRADVSSEDRKKLIIEGLYQLEGDPDGFLFDEESLAANFEKLKNFMDRDGSVKLDEREKRLGFVIQGEDRDDV